MCGDLRRLDRTLATSARYLQLQDSPGAARLDVQRLDSVNAFFARLADGRDDLTVVPLTLDVPFRTDPEWLTVCVRNLLENAYAHGAPPVELVLDHAAGVLSVTIRDAGDSAALDLAAATTAFHRGADSRGLGLGLSIVAHAVRDLGGELTHRAQPTELTLHLPEVAA